MSGVCVLFTYLNPGYQTQMIDIWLLLTPGCAWRSSQSDFCAEYYMYEMFLCYDCSFFVCPCTVLATSQGKTSACFSTW